MFDKIFEINMNNYNIIGLTDELKSIYIYNMFCQNKKSILLVCNSLYEANKIYNSLAKYTNKILLFPMDDFLTSEALAVSPELEVTRLETLKSLIKNNNQIVITNLMGYLRYLPNPTTYQKNYFSIDDDTQISIENLIKKLNNMGYTRETIVNKTGEMAVRGFVVDIFPVAYENPVRIEFWGDEIENIKEINVDTQLTIKKIDKIEISPKTEFLTDKEKPENELYRNLGKYTQIVNIEAYLDNSITFFNDYKAIEQSNETLNQEINDYNKSLDLSSNTKYMNDFLSIIPKKYYTFSDLDENIGIRFNSKQIDILKGSFDEKKQFLKKSLKNNQIIICLQNRYQVNNLLEQFNDDDFIFTNESEIINNKINIIIKDITEGFIFNKMMIISCKEMFNIKEKKQYKSNFKLGTKLRDINKLEIGDYIVHYAHGIGRYCGLKTLTKNGLKKDYLQIEYKGDDKLYIPVEQIELINKYSSKEGTEVKMNSLNSTAWQKTRMKIQKKIETIAPELLELYAKRQMVEGFSFDKDGKEAIVFAQQFPFEPTADQLKAYEQIKNDMEKNRPMDRLLCGDVGYGKTEVAFRAIFKAIMSNKQTAILCPTTILSHQHYKNALERFKQFPVNIELLNRFTTFKQRKNILERLKEGKIDLIIGTHRILSDDVQFKNLGLLVIDEEQRFGVKHKEKIKKYKNSIDVLTLSATPIPRTLQMSMTGVRDLSLIETPPVNRFPVQTYVLKENIQIIKDAIYKEISRGGQVFILYNKVEDMLEKVNQISLLVPEAKIAYAHGRMDKTKLENVMMDFTEKLYDILICTTIIETGIDIPTVNTLIILDSDRFGLSQLYQIRGRVGRSDKIAYCYLMYDEHKMLNDIAVKRLKAIKEFTELGSGFKIAMRDLALRGAGDILGSEQAGFVSAVGIDLFLELLNEEVSKLKGNEVKKPELKENKTLLEVETTIDDSVAKESELKIEIHQKINQIKNKDDLNKTINELTDRFGKLPENLIIYMYESWFEELTNELNITKITQTKNFVEIVFPSEITENIDGQKLFMEVNNLSRMFRFKMYNESLAIILDTIKLEKHFIYYLIDLLLIVKESIKKQG